MNIKLNKNELGNVSVLNFIKHDLKLDYQNLVVLAAVLNVQKDNKKVAEVPPVR